jgi:hypothetical protein
MGAVKVNVKPGVALGVMLVGTLTVIALAALLSLFYGWILMLLMGVLYHNFSDSVPLVGYWACCVPAFLIRILVSSAAPSGASS